ncbi:MAG: PhzF family phenazine biosynthesis protein, partial [Gammaproteobacteria bacterium]
QHPHATIVNAPGSVERMARFRYVVADVFTDTPLAGNGLAVFTDAGEIPEEQLQPLARELNLSETVFVFPPERSEHTRRLRIFTPGTELPFAGHPTIGTGFVLASTGEIPLAGDLTQVVFEEGVGPVSVSIRASEGRPSFVQLTATQLPEFGPAPPAQERIAALLSLDPSDLVGDEWASQSVSCGVPFLFVPIRDLAALGRARLDLTVWGATFAGSWAPHIFPFTINGPGSGVDARARMFAPAMGISEDPATGAAAAALAGYLAARDSTGQDTLRWVVEQGVEMGRASRIHVEADRADGRVLAVRVGGGSVLVGEGAMEIPTLGA